MQPSDALGLAAQIAVALAGFAGVVVAFRSGLVHEWKAIDKMRLRFLLNNSITPLILCLLALWLVSVDPHQVWIWRACSALAIALITLIGIRTPDSHSAGTGGINSHESVFVDERDRRQIERKAEGRIMNCESDASGS
jgi:hypothetical protein